MLPKLLLHACCATCSGWLSQELAKEYSVSIYFDNSNIFPKTEFLKRSSEAEEFYRKQGFEFIMPEYNHEDWQNLVRGLEGEPERGSRCHICYRFRLDRTAKYAKENGFDCFATTLTISPHKDAKAVNAIGKGLESELGIKFLEGDWKKQNGFKNAMEFSCEHDFYRQSYCGCEFSLRQ